MMKHPHSESCSWMFDESAPARIALVCVAKDEDDTIGEWVSYNKKLGFTKIFMYENDWSCPVSDPILVKARINGRHKQMESYAHWIARHKRRFDFVCFLDCDEFIVLKKHGSMQDFISEYGNPYGIAMNWVMFGSGGQLSPAQDRDSLLKRFIHRSKRVNQHTKVVLGTRTLHFMASPHHANKYTLDTNRKKVKGPFNPGGPIDVVQVNHYYHKSREEWERRVQRGQADHTRRTMRDWNRCKNHHLDQVDTTARDWFYGTKAGGE